MPRKSKGDYSNEVLERSPVRVTRFLSGLSGAPEILSLLAAQAGLTDDDIAEGQKLLLACLTPPPYRPPVPGGPNEARDAFKAVAEWRDKHFRLYEAALRRRFPSAADYLFEASRSKKGMDAILEVPLFLSAVDKLQKGQPSRRATQKEDRKAVELLSTRGLTTQERTRVAALARTAMRSSVPPGLDLDAQARSAAARRAALTALKQWEEEWFAAAHAVLEKRIHLIRLGLATRKKPTKPTTKPGPNA